MKTGRNQPCPCGSGRKYKHCCLKTTREIPLRHKLVIGAVGVALAMSVVAIALTLASDEARTDRRVWSEEHQHWHDLP